MATSPSSTRVLTELDHIRISNLLKQPGMAFADELESVIDAAELISSYEVPSQLVTMNSQVRIADGKTGEERTLTLCYPQEADPNTGHVSVLSPVGTSLLGLSEGQLARWATPNGSEASAKILKVVFQPEESGDYLR
ncbi:regulator of nucleoside diphosphate kinase [Polaromonas sp. OV174]|uniref:nucleoside diphosphate kinase regulator n=1 Tax=Polaromonas sp. OV174 TaxID=1855300 RepID=UPI0008E90F22|nr:nucleoside diphosphate kinase regulator [Polaromonas sp. OV174]SFB67005.1 regulator of nucleoside diphosphate kinase [Polaromonas sp. OV174]